MSAPHTNNQTTLRYSPRPLSTYTKTTGNTSFGPSTSRLLTTPEAWNLAYLSHDYDVRIQPLDPHFTVHINRTVRFRLDGSGSDLVSTQLDGLFGSLLNQPAPRFVYLLRQHPALTQLPMYVAYGDAWLETLAQRERLCCAEMPYSEVEEPVTLDLRAAQDVLRRIGKR
ncbi:hypothetical protein DIC66_21900 [Rhodoferax lacus]|uniref:Uncharacterized protein n=1 Tax=Rhodoferax lacus TaxID=2184758 RepID=A0A3E1R5X0_9BURK|nr:hypothetical protein [Rhodoferax lacus]RFO94734.1 hypothetical protein DIC66_21900 [Rhodoferax lacus]